MEKRRISTFLRYLPTGRLCCRVLCYFCVGLNHEFNDNSPDGRYNERTVKGGALR